MEIVLLGYYLGLLVFAINGLVWLGYKQERHAAKAREDRIIRLLQSRRLRR